MKPELVRFAQCTFGDGGYYYHDGFDRAVCSCGWKSAPSNKHDALVALWKAHKEADHPEPMTARQQRMLKLKPYSTRKLFAKRRRKLVAKPRSEGIAIPNLKPGTTIKGAQFGVRFEKRGPTDDHIVVQILSEDDGFWDRSGSGFSSAWLNDLIAVLTLGRFRLIDYAEPDPKEGVGYRFRPMPKHCAHCGIIYPGNARHVCAKRKRR